MTASLPGCHSGPRFSILISISIKRDDLANALASFPAQHKVDLLPVSPPVSFFHLSSMQSILYGSVHSVRIGIGSRKSSLFLFFFFYCCALANSSVQRGTHRTCTGRTTMLSYFTFPPPISLFFPPPPSFSPAPTFGRAFRDVRVWFVVFAKGFIKSTKTVRAFLKTALQVNSIRSFIFVSFKL